MAMEIRTVDTSAQFVVDAIREQQRTIAPNQIIAGGFIVSQDGNRQFTGAVFTCPSKTDVDAALHALIYGRETDITKEVEGQVKSTNRELYAKERDAIDEGKVILENWDGRTVQSAVLSNIFESCQAKLETVGPLPPVARTQTPTSQSIPAPAPAPAPAPNELPKPAPYGGSTEMSEKSRTAPRGNLRQSVREKSTETIVEKPEAPSARGSLPSRTHKPKRRHAPLWDCCDDYCIRIR